jgi:hypothetical protein
MTYVLVGVPDLTLSKLQQHWSQVTKPSAMLVRTYAETWDSPLVL